ncbi:RNA-binding protein 25 [Durusdinium trenchii]|uniref:RNA-binding protein 25 n=1 Tax=Durusdinium trenchii TaxID=1381693 RepID=A0ABP0L206_9DINO
MIVGIFDGIIKKFNEKFPRQGVKQFDKITAVNGKRGSANEMRRMMVSAIADETLDLLQLTIRRPTEIQVQLERPGTLGLQVNYTDLRLGSGGVARFPEEAGLGGVLISKIVPDGLVDRWNADPKNPLVSVGDRIIALNGEDLKGDDLLESSVTDSSAVSWNSQVTEEEARRKEKKERKSRKQRHHSADAHADRPAKKDDGALPKPHNWAEEVVKASLDPQNQWEFPGPSGKAGYVGCLSVSVNPCHTLT